VGFSTTKRYKDAALFRADLDTNNTFSYCVRIDPSTCYDLSFLVYYNLVSGQSLPGNSVLATVFFVDAAFNVANSPNRQVLLAGNTPTWNYNLLEEGLNTITVQGIIPASTAVFAIIQLRAIPPSAQFIECAMGHAIFVPTIAQSIETPTVSDFASTSRPASGDWTRGDIVYSSSFTQNSPFAWECITAGTPGTWKALSNGCNGTTAQRPALTANDGGFDYYDSTLGRPIVWRGNAWVDATGAVV
jgi:hypothetical protein